MRGNFIVKKPDRHYLKPCALAQNQAWEVSADRTYPQCHAMRMALDLFGLLHPNTFPESNHEKNIRQDPVEPPFHKMPDQ